jgi:hypothetical protein
MSLLTIMDRRQAIEFILDRFITQSSFNASLSKFRRDAILASIDSDAEHAPEMCTCILTELPPFSGSEGSGQLYFLGESSIVVSGEINPPCQNMVLWMAGSRGGEVINIGADGNRVTVKVRKCTKTTCATDHSPWHYTPIWNLFV